MSLHWDTKWIEFSPHGGHGVDKKGWRNLVSGLQPSFGNDDSKDFYQLLFLSFFRGHSYVVKENGHALGWQLKGRSGLATLLRVPVDIKRGTERRLWCGYKKYRSFHTQTKILLICRLQYR